MTLTEHLRDIVKAARSKGVGMWPAEALNSMKKATIRGIDDAESLVMWPKLFRRLVAYFADGFQDLLSFDSWMRADPRDRDDRVLLPNGELGNMHDLVKVTANQAWLTQYNPEDVIVLPDEA